MDCVHYLVDIYGRSPVAMPARDGSGSLLLTFQSEQVAAAAAIIFGYTMKLGLTVKTVTDIEAALIVNSRGYVGKLVWDNEYEQVKA